MPGVLFLPGAIRICSYGFPNSYGTLGYALRLTVRLIPAKPYVHMTHTRFTDPESYFSRIAERADSSVDYLDGTIFSRDEMYLTEGEFVDQAPAVSDYTYMDIYYKSIQRKSRGLAYGERLHLALGHGLVLVFEALPRAKTCDPKAV